MRIAKPTLLQSVLGRPSQSYSASQEKSYFSNKAHLLRNAGDVTHAVPYDTNGVQAEHNGDDDAVTLQPSSIAAQDDQSDESDSEEIFYTPNSSPRVSMASTVAVPTPPARSDSGPSTEARTSHSMASVSSASLDGHSIFSSESYPSTPSTNITTPLSSDSGHDAFTKLRHYDTSTQALATSGPNGLTRSTKTTKPVRSASARLSSSRASSTRPASSHRSSSTSRSSPTSRSRPAPTIMMSMTALLELDENAPEGIQNPLSNAFVSPPPSRQRSVSSHSSRGHQRHHSLPATISYNPSIPSSGTPGYTSLTLPRAPPPAFGPNANISSKHHSILGGSDQVDLTKSGIAQTTMASVEVVRGLVGKSLFSRKHTRGGDVLGFTSYRIPPSSVPAGAVLVQVWSVGVDQVDVRLASAESTGFVPGRSFAGRVLECGWEVKDEVARKGDWVVGLLDVRKCGALQEFIVADRHRIHRVPHPLTVGNMSTDELASLALCGVAAHRAVRTFSMAFGSASMIPLSDGGVWKFTNDHEHGSARRALVLRGHDGVGAMAMQMLVHRGWRVSVHAPMPKVKHELEYMRDVENRVRLWGGDEVVFDDGEGAGAVIRAIDQLVVDGDTFDAVLDTIGGKDVWEASQKLLGGKKASGQGQFTTLVGDSPAKTIPSAGSHFKAGLRSLRNTHSQDGVKVGYAWVSVAQDIDWAGEDIRESIGAVLRLAVAEGIRPRSLEPNRIVPFERAPSVFSGSLLHHGGIAVVKVVS